MVTNTIKTQDSAEFIANAKKLLGDFNISDVAVIISDEVALANKVDKKLEAEAPSPNGLKVK